MSIQNSLRHCGGFEILQKLMGNILVFLEEHDELVRPTSERSEKLSEYLGTVQEISQLVFDVVVLICTRNAANYIEFY